MIRNVLILVAAVATLQLYSWVRPAEAQRADAEVLISLAILKYDEKNYDEALELLKQALQLDPRNERGLYYSGLTYMAQLRPEAAIQPLEAALANQPKDPDIRFQLGVAYFTVGQYEKAEPLLEGVFREQPDRENLGYYVGVLRYRRKAYAEALAALKAVKTGDPNIQQLALFYRGLASGTLGLSDEAARDLFEAQRLLAVSPLTEPTARIRDAIIRARTLEKRFRGQLSLGTFYDDNVSINPSRSNDPDAQLLRRQRHTAPGLLLSATGDYSFYREGPVEAIATYSFLQTLNFNGLSEFNLMDHLGGLSGFYRGTVGGLPYQLSGSYTGEYIFLGKGVDSFLLRFGPTFTVTLIEPIVTVPVLGNVGNLTTVLNRLAWKNFMGAGEAVNGVREQKRDAFNVTAGFLHTFRFYNDRFLLRLGYEYDNEHSEGADFSYNGNHLRAGAQVALPWGGLILRYDYDVHWRDYDNRNSRFPSSAPNTVTRNDTQHTHLVQLEQPITDSLSLTWQYQNILNRSNLAVYDYKKNIISLTLSWVF